jgi:beta-xylosidase
MSTILTSLTLPYRRSLIVLLFSLAVYFELGFAIAASTMGGGDHYPSLSQRRDTSSAVQRHRQQEPPYSGNPIFPGWYADPDAHIFEGQYWVYPSLSLAYDQQTYLDCFSSPDLVTWTKHPRILDFADIPWSTNRAAWAPAVAFRDRAYYLYFSAGDGAGIGVAKSTTGPAGPFRDVLNAPLIAEVMFGAEPIDPAVFIDPDDDRIYLFYGGWSHGVVVELNDDMVSFKSEFKEITPPNYVEAPWMIKRNGVYYYMYSVGG